MSRDLKEGRERGLKVHEESCSRQSYTCSLWGRTKLIILHSKELS